MKKIFVLCVALFISCLPGSGANTDQTLTGYVSCSICATKGATESHADCMEQCLAKGADVVLLTDDTKQSVRIENPDSVRRYHAHRVALFGYMVDTGFHVVSVRII